MNENLLLNIFEEDLINYTAHRLLNNYPNLYNNPIEFKLLIESIINYLNQNSESLIITENRNNIYSEITKYLNMIDGILEALDFLINETEIKKLYRPYEILELTNLTQYQKNKIEKNYYA